MKFTYQGVPPKFTRLRLYRQFRHKELHLKITRLERVHYLSLPLLQIKIDKLDVTWVTRTTILHQVVINSLIPLFCLVDLERTDLQFIWILILWYQELPKELLKRKKISYRAWIIAKAFNFRNYQLVRNRHWRQY